MANADERMAVTVIGGYLGSGKTTLVNHLLKNATERVAIIVNDFGDINVDLDLIESRDDNTIELSNGCICCSMVDGFSAALDAITAYEPRPDRLVVETSGVADPAQVAAYGHGPGLALDAVIVLVDVETIRAASVDKYVGQTVTQQLASAEILIANKADLVDASELAETVAWLGEQCPDAFILTATNSEVAAEVLFGRPSTLDDEPGDAHHHPERIFTTTTIAPDEPLTRDEVEAMMQALPPETTVRAKGLVQLADEPDPYVLQRVGLRWTLRKSRTPWPGEPASQVVVISRIEHEF